MLHIYINTILSTLENHIQSRLSLKSKAIELCNPSQVNEDLKLKNKILANLVNFSREKDISNNYDYVVQGNNFIGKRGPLLFNLEILFAANFEASNALEGLRQLSSLIGFFQANSSIAMPIEIGNGESIAASISTYEGEALSNIWKRLSLPYMPSVICRFSTIFIRDEVDKGFAIPRIDTIDIQPVSS